MKKETSRYSQVREILNKASKGSTNEYQGYGKFWELPLEELLQVELYGVKMIGDSGSESGLIRGLRGEPPFDGNQFPRLLWGVTEPLAEEDIDFISQWIDDGCPEEDAPKPETSSCCGGDGPSPAALSLAKGTTRHTFSQAPVLNAERGGTKARKNIEALTPDELKRLRAAVGQMRAWEYQDDERSWTYWARIHANACQHGWEQFLPWHRVYLAYLEQQLQDIDPLVTLPYWEWSSYADDQPTTATGGNKIDNGVIPEAYRGFVTKEAIDKLDISKANKDKLTKIVGQTFNSGARLLTAAGIKYNAAADSDVGKILTELEVINPLFYRKRYPTINLSLIPHYPQPEEINRILEQDNFWKFGSGPPSNHYFGSLESVHNFMHNFSGGLNPNYTKDGDQNREPQFGDMVDARVTAFDPIFWGHHANVDRLWALWQESHPNGHPQNMSAPMPPFTQIVGDAEHVSDFGYEYVKSAHVAPVNPNVALMQFRSEKAGVPKNVVKCHRSAEVRLRGVQFVPLGATIRVFLNEPKATVNTPVEDNPNFAGAIHTFGASCVGGPGHCSLPFGSGREFDARPRHRKTPGNYNLDVTSCVQKLCKAGATDFTVSIVVVGMDGKLIEDALYLDAISLVFQD